MKLVIVESPAKSKTIEKYLGSDFTVRASIGHIRDLPKSNKQAIDIPAGFVPHYEISKGKEKVVSELSSLAKKAEMIYLATDPDREGEAIAWHIFEACGLDKMKSKVKRVAFNEITKTAVDNAIKNPRDIDDNLKQAQEARRVLDRLVGYDLSGLIWKKVRYGLSAGRVQSPALRIIMEREREIRAFITEKYWTIEANIENKEKVSLVTTCDEEPRDEKKMKEILDYVNKNGLIVSSIEEKEVKRSPKAPFTTSTLQQAASTRLGFSPSKTMQVAQKLYEQGFITYMRTDSTNLSASIFPEIEKVIRDNFPKVAFVRRTYTNKNKNAQEAHEAIRPSHIINKMAGKNRDEVMLYSLIWARTLASQMEDATLLRTTLKLKSGDNKNIPLFGATGSRTLFPGWLLVDPGSRGEDVEIPKFIEKEKVKVLDVISIEKETAPPNRYSEAGLVKELEKRGIGRPSTYASIIKTLEEREYVIKENKALKPTDTGDVVSSFLEQNFENYISDTFTAEMEDKLDDIAEGKKEYLQTLKTFYTQFSKDVKAKNSIEKITNMGEAPKDMLCPICGEKMVIKLSKNGKFYSCAKFPECAGARTIEGKVMEGPKMLEEDCEKCGKKLMEREGRYGKFISCSSYPKCKFIKKDKSLELQNSSGVTCPTCQKGMICQKRGRFGFFYSCSNYPDCKFNMKTKPTGNTCKMCGKLMMEGAKTIPERCMDKACPNHNPHKLAPIA